MSAAETGNPVADFDIEAWRTGRRRPTRVIAVTNDPGAGLRLTQLRSELTDIRRDIDTARAEGRKIPGARAGATTTPDTEHTVEQIREVLAHLDGTWTFVHVRALTPHESNEVAGIDNRIDRIAASLASTDKRDNDRPAATISGSETEPGVTQSVDQWHDLLDVIGSAQALKLEAALNELTMAAVTPDFSRRVSSLLDGQNSS